MIQNNIYLKNKLGNPPHFKYNHIIKLEVLYLTNINLIGNQIVF